MDDPSGNKLEIMAVNPGPAESQGSQTAGCFQLVALGKGNIHDPMERRKFIDTLMGTSAIAAMPNISKGATTPKIKVGQIGLSHPHAKGKLDAIRKLPDIYELVGVAEPDPGQRSGITGVNFITEDELLDTRGLQAVAIETRVLDLVPTAAKAIDAGCHIHLDKPAGPSLGDFQALSKAAQSKGLTIQMGYMLRYNPAFQFMFKAAKEGWFGEIMEIDAMMGKKASLGLRKELAGFKGGGFFELACHILDAAIHLLGQPESVTAYNLRTGATSGDTFADNQLAVLAYPRATATLRCNHNDPFGFPRRRFQISGTQGGMEIKPLESGKFTLFLDQERDTHKKGIQEIQFPSGRSYVPEFEDLAEVIREEKQLEWTPAHDLLTHKTLLEISGMLD
jgi:predicted dehydrogenase